MDRHGNGIANDISNVILMIGLGVFVLWGGHALGDWLFTEDSIRTTEPIIPELEITVKNNVVDTLYVYRDIKN